MKTLLNRILVGELMLMPMFEEDGAGGFSGGSEGNSNDGSGNENNQNDQNQNEGMLSQEKVNSIIKHTKEKAEKTALKKLFGVESDEDLTKAMNIFNAEQEKKKPEAQKAIENQRKIDEALNRANLAEKKLEVIKLGVKAECADDFVVLAMSKVSDTSDFSAVAEELKKVYPHMLNNPDEENSGTGSNSNPRRKHQNSGKGSIGARLAKNKITNDKEQYYFKR